MIKPRIRTISHKIILTSVMCPHIPPPSPSEPTLCTTRLSALQVWVSTSAHVDLLVSIGVAADKLYVVPEPVNTTFFDPATTHFRSQATVMEDGREFDARELGSFHRGRRGWARPMDFGPLITPDTFVFFAAFVWDRSKVRGGCSCIGQCIA